MSDPCTKQRSMRSMIDLQEFERRLFQPDPSNQKDNEALAELLRIIGGQGETRRTVFELEFQSQAEAQRDTQAPGECKQPDEQKGVPSGDFTVIEAGLDGGEQPQPPNVPEAERSRSEHKSLCPQAPLLRGDFAAIEAALLGGLQEQAGAGVSEADVPNALPNADFRSDRSLYLDEEPVSRGAATRQIASRRPLYAVVATIIAGVAGIAVSSGSQNPDPPIIATIKGESASAAPETQTKTISAADVPAQETAILSKPPEPSPVTFANNTNGAQQPLGLAQAKEKTPILVALVGSQAPRNKGPAAEPAQPQPQTPAEPLSTPAAGKPNAVTDDLSQSDGTPLPNGAALQSDAVRSPLPPQRPAVAARAQSAKTAASVAKPSKTTTAAAAKAGRNSDPQQISSKTKAAKPAGPIDAAPAPISEAKAEAPAAQPSPASPGAFEFIQTAMNSITTTTAKLLEWGRN